MTHVPVLRHRRGGFIDDKWIGIRGDDAVLQSHDARGVAAGQLGVVGDHDDEPVLRHFLQQVHDLDGRLGVQGACRLIGQQDGRIVHQRSGDGHALHLSAGELARLLFNLIAEADIFKSFSGAGASFGTGDAGDRESEFDIGQDCLMRDQVVGLKNEADGVIAVTVPVAVFVLSCGDAVYNQISAVVLVQTADDVEHGTLAGAGWPENGDEFAVAQTQ